MGLAQLARPIFVFQLTAVQERLNVVYQVHRRVAEVAEKDLSSDPIGRRRLDQKRSPSTIKPGLLEGYTSY
ncbi:MAG: hypothetical protein ACLQGU_02935 [bacterium]